MNMATEMITEIQTMRNVNTEDSLNETSSEISIVFTNRDNSNTNSNNDNNTDNTITNITTTTNNNTDNNNININEMANNSSNIGTTVNTPTNNTLYSNNLSQVKIKKNASTSTSKLSPTFKRASNSFNPFFLYHLPSTANGEILNQSSPSSPSLQSASSSSSTATLVQTNNVATNVSLIENDNDLNPGSSSSSASAATTLSSLNTSALVRTISNGSTFGPIPNWPLCAVQSSSSSDQNHHHHHHHHHHQHHSKPQSGVPESASHMSMGGSGIITPTSPNMIGYNVSNNANNLANGNGANIMATTAPPQINFPIILNLPLIFGDNYVLINQLEASNLYRCLEMGTNEEYYCKVVHSKMYHEFLEPHYRMDGHENINQIQKIIIGRMHTFILFPPSFGDLHSFVRTKRRLRESEAMPLFKQILQVVADCHAQGIVLRDLKLRKFIFSDKESNHLKLETLEGASLFDEDDTLTDKHGCPAYVSPEILLSDSFSGLAADCWGLGVILYTMLVGRYPFHDVNPPSVFCKIRRGTYCIPETLSKQAKCLIRSLMCVDPNERLSAEDALAHQWFQAENNDTGSIIAKRNAAQSLQQLFQYYSNIQIQYVAPGAFIPGPYFTLNQPNSLHSPSTPVFSPPPITQPLPPLPPPPPPPPPTPSNNNTNNNNNNNNPANHPMLSSQYVPTIVVTRNQLESLSQCYANSTSSQDQIVPDLKLD